MDEEKNNLHLVIGQSSQVPASDLLAFCKKSVSEVFQLGSTKELSELLESTESHVSFVIPKELIHIKHL